MVENRAVLAEFWRPARAPGSWLAELDRATGEPARLRLALSPLDWFRRRLPLVDEQPLAALGFGLRDQPASEEPFPRDRPRRDRFEEAFAREETAWSRGFAGRDGDPWEPTASSAVGHSRESVVWPGSDDARFATPTGPELEPEVARTFGPSRRPLPASGPTSLDAARLVALAELGPPPLARPGTDERTGGRGERPPSGISPSRVNDPPSAGAPSPGRSGSGGRTAADHWPARGGSNDVQPPVNAVGRPLGSVGRPPRDSLRTFAAMPPPRTRSAGYGTDAPPGVLTPAEARRSLLAQLAGLMPVGRSPEAGDLAGLPSHQGDSSRRQRRASDPRPEAPRASAMRPPASGSWSRVPTPSGEARLGAEGARGRAFGDRGRTLTVATELLTRLASGEADRSTRRAPIGATRDVAEVGLEGGSPDTAPSGGVGPLDRAGLALLRDSLDSLVGHPPADPGRPGPERLVTPPVILQSTPPTSPSAEHRARAPIEPVEGERTAGPTVQNTFNVTVHVPGGLENGDDELAARLTRVLVEQARRNGIDV